MPGREHEAVVPQPKGAPSPPRWDLDFDRLASDLAPLGSATRLRLLNYLTTPRYLEEIASFLQMNRYAAKKHVDQLLEAGMITRTPAQRGDALVVEYRIVQEKLFEVFDAMRALGTLRPVGASRDDTSRTKAAEAHPSDRRAGAESPRLVVVYGIEVGASHVVDGGAQPWLIGRDATCGLSLQGDPFVSARHAQVEWKGGAHVLTDLFSTNGTTLDWARIDPGRPMPLQNGSIVGVGKTLFVFRDR